MDFATDIVLFSTADWDNPSWTNKQHMACEMARRGCRVFYVESFGLRRPSLRSWDLNRMVRRLHRAMTPVRQVQERIWVFSPLVIPLHGFSWVRKLNGAVLQRSLYRELERLHFDNPIVWTYHPMMRPLLSALPHSMVVYHCVDDLSASPRMPAQSLRTAEDALLAEADVVFATSRVLQERCQQRRTADVHYHPNVVDFEHFAQARQPKSIPADLAAIPGPRIGFVGAISEYKVNFPLIAEVARRRRDWHWVLIGPVGEGQPWTRIDALREPNIHFLGPKHYQDLPAYLSGLDVATVLAPDNAYTRSMFPMKFFEYLAAGRPVIASNIPALAEFQQSYWQVSNGNEVIEAVEQALREPGERLRQGMDRARQFTWTWRTDRMFHILRARTDDYPRAGLAGVNAA